LYLNGHNRWRIQEGKKESGTAKRITEREKGQPSSFVRAARALAFRKVGQNSRHERLPNETSKGGER